MVLSGRQTDQHHLVTGRTVQRPASYRTHTVRRISTTWSPAGPYSGLPHTESTQSDGSAPPGHRPDRTAACHIQKAHSQTDQHHLVTGRTVQRPATYRTHTVRRISTTWSLAGPYSGLPHTEHTQSDGSAPPGHRPDRTAACLIQNTHSQTDQHHLVTGRPVQRPGRHREYTQKVSHGERRAECGIHTLHITQDIHRTPSQKPQLKLNVSYAIPNRTQHKHSILVISSNTKPLQANSSRNTPPPCSPSNGLYQSNINQSNVVSSFKVSIKSSLPTGVLSLPTINPPSHVAVSSVRSVYPHPSVMRTARETLVPPFSAESSAESSL